MSFVMCFFPTDITLKDVTETRWIFSSSLGTYLSLPEWKLPIEVPDCLPTTEDVGSL